MDHLVNSLVSRFSHDMSLSLSAGFLHPKDVGKLTRDTIADIYAFYKDDSPDTTIPVLFQKEVELWQECCKLENEDEGVALSTQSWQEVLSFIKDDIFSSIFIVLKIYLTTPVTSNSCERIFSALRRLKSWTRSTIGQNRLNGIAPIHVHHDKIEPETFNKKILNRYDPSRCKRIWTAKYKLTFWK